MVRGSMRGGELASGGDGVEQSRQNIGLDRPQPPEPVLILRLDTPGCRAFNNPVHGSGLEVTDFRACVRCKTPQVPISARQPGWPSLVPLWRSTAIRNQSRAISVPSSVSPADQRNRQDGQARPSRNGECEDPVGRRCFRPPHLYRGRLSARRRRAFSDQTHCRRAAGGVGGYLSRWPCRAGGGVVVAAGSVRQMVARPHAARYERPLDGELHAPIAGPLRLLRSKPGPTCSGPGGAIFSSSVKPAGTSAWRSRRAAISWRS